jgi:DNA-damage-inducible protein D
MTELSTEVDLFEDFEDCAKENGVRYWEAHDLMVRLGYSNYQSFAGVINKSISSCAQLGIQISDAFIQTTIMLEGKSVPTYRLTRFACFLAAMHADDKKEQVAKAKIYFAAIASSVLEQAVTDDDLPRIELREEIKIGEKMLSGVAKAAGIHDAGYAFFKDAGIRGMYNMSLRDLRSRKGVGEATVLYDFMGSTELAGNYFRITQTAERIRAKKIRGQLLLQEAAKTIGKQVRSTMLENSGVAPENLPIAEDVNKVKTRLKSANRKMMKLDAVNLRNSI